MADSNASCEKDDQWYEEVVFNCTELRSLALQIDAFKFHGKDRLFADRMIACNDGFYSRSFYETALQIETLKSEGQPLEEAARALVGKIPTLESLRVEIDWGEIAIVKRLFLVAFATGIQKLGIQGPDSRLALQILDKKPAADAWKLMALRYVDVELRLGACDRFCREFYEDKDRVDWEFSELRKHIHMVEVRDACWCVTTPLFPPWRDDAIWDESEKGYGFIYDLADYNASDLQPGDDNNSNDIQAYEEAFPLLKNDEIPVHVKPLLPNNAWVDKASKKTFMNSGIGGKLQHTPPSSSTTEFHIDMSKAMTIREVWGFALLGQYVGRHPGHFLINAMMKSWGVRRKYRIEGGWMIFYFDSEADQEKVLLGGPYLIQGRPMILKHIPDKFAFNRRDVAIVPLWIRIHDLASRFWTPDILGGIASYIGTPLYMDPVTDGRKRHTYARVLVEINLAAPVTRKVPLMFSDGVSFDCTFLVENEPKYCHGCCSFGHDVSSCEFAAKKDHVDMKHNKATAKVPVPKNDTAAKLGDGCGHDAKDKAVVVHAQEQDLEKTVEQQPVPNLPKDAKEPEDPQHEAIPEAVDKEEKLVEKQATKEDRPPHVSPPKIKEKVDIAQPNKQQDKATLPPEPQVSVANCFATFAPGTSSRTSRARKNGAKGS